MKIILSRKGFDSTFGCQPSPIMPNGNLLSLPIPYSNDCNKYSDLSYEGHTYFDIIRQLNPYTKIKDNDTCHLDPDIRRDVKNREDGWKPAFGQHGAAQSHLIKNGVKEGDIFLFFGWFKFTQWNEGKLQYIKSSNYPNGFHAIYGYLEIKEMISPKNDNKKMPDWLTKHPHADYGKKYKSNNMIYVSDTDIAGYLKFDTKLILTKSGQPNRATWVLPEFFHPKSGVELSYNKILSLWKRGLENNTILETKRGQEFVFLKDPKGDVEKWALGLINNSEKL